MTLDELDQLTKDELIALVLKLAERIAKLEGKRDDHNSPKAKRVPSWAKVSVPEPKGKQARAEEWSPDSRGRERPYGCAREREEPTLRVQHAAVRGNKAPPGVSRESYFGRAPGDGEYPHH